MWRGGRRCCGARRPSACVARRAELERTYRRATSLQDFLAASATRRASQPGTTNGTAPIANQFNGERAGVCEAVDASHGADGTGDSPLHRLARCVCGMFLPPCCCAYTKRARRSLPQPAAGWERSSQPGVGRGRAAPAPRCHVGAAGIRGQAVCGAAQENVRRAVLVVRVVWHGRLLHAQRVLLAVLLGWVGVRAGGLRAAHLACAVLRTATAPRAPHACRYHPLAAGAQGRRLARVHRLCKRGGRLCLSDHPRDWVAAGQEGARMRPPPPSPVRSCRCAARRCHPPSLPPPCRRAMA